MITVYKLDRETGAIEAITETDALDYLAGDDTERRIAYSEELRDETCGYSEIIVRDIYGKETWFSRSERMLVIQQNCNVENVDCTRVNGLPALGSNNDGAFRCPNHTPVKIEA